MQFMKSKSITFVLLVTFVMSWTGIAFAFVPAFSNSHHTTMQTSQSKHNVGSEHCEKQIESSQVHVMQHDMNGANAHCQQGEMGYSNHQSSHAPCQDCSIPECQNSVCSFNLLEQHSFNVSTFNSNNVLNSIYGIFHSSDFKQDILRPPQI